jgi:hypothetical protein
MLPAAMRLSQQRMRDMDVKLAIGLGSFVALATLYCTVQYNNTALYYCAAVGKNT